MGLALCEPDRERAAARRQHAAQAMEGAAVIAQLHALLDRIGRHHDHIVRQRRHAARDGADGRAAFVVPGGSSRSRSASPSAPRTDVDMGTPLLYCSRTLSVSSGCSAACCVSPVSYTHLTLPTKRIV